MFPSTRSSREGKPSAAGSCASDAGDEPERGSIRTRLDRPIGRFVAIGDSFTEGLDDELRVDGRHRGWADRAAMAAMRAQGTREIEYANLAVRGRLTHQVVTEQVPAAIALGPDMVSLGAGVNDALRRSFDLDALATDIENGVRELRASGARVLVFAFGDPARRSGVLGKIAGRMAGLRSATVEIARRHGCYLVDFWGVARYDDDRLWSPDRLHLSAAGHEVTARAVLEAWGLGDGSWRTPLGDPPRTGWWQRRGQDLHWVGEHAGPWFARRARGISSGSGIEPKDPVYRIYCAQPDGVHKGRVGYPQERDNPWR